MSLHDFEVKTIHSSGLQFMRRKDHSFGKKRKEALDFWKTSSSRIREPGSADDDFSNSIVCNLQNRVGEIYGETAHLALFCNLGDWECHITDILLDTSNDEVRFDDDNHARKLFRYYSRLMLIVSELVADISSVVATTKSNKKKSDKVHRNEISNGDALCGFVNNFVKHKSKNSHCHDHHLPIAFEDSGNVTKSEKDITFDALNSEDKERFFIPRLQSIVEIALSCETVLREKLQSAEAFDLVFKAYKGRK